MINYLYISRGDYTTSWSFFENINFFEIHDARLDRLSKINLSIINLWGKYDLNLTSNKSGDKDLDKLNVISILYSIRELCFLLNWMK